MKGYTLREHQTIRAISSEGYLFQHDRSGAQVFYLSNKNDNNKVFSISFCTPPEDDSGIPHILEHSVLCGSEKYPLKDPFIQLAKGSLNTFLNAMTYPDKTMYPVASQNDQDFLNLMDVYMDAVFHPAILKDPRTLMQEGWHYEISDDLSELSVKGVVYNEMKGAFSSPEELLESRIKKELYPDTPYSFESGGDPDSIPTLDYEHFLAYYRSHYQPSNSYIFIYGDGDMEEHLRFLDERYLGKMENSGVSFAQNWQKPFAGPKTVRGVYPAASEEDEGKAYLSYSTAYGPVMDPLQYYASDILEYMLLETEGAPLKTALQDAGIGDDVFGVIDNSILQPCFSIVVKDADPEKEALFVKTVRSVADSLVRNGFRREMVEGALNRFEFHLREGDYGSTPTGLIYAITCMDSWMHDESPMKLLHYDEVFAALRKKAQAGYFEQLLKQIVLENPHALIYTLAAEPGLAARREAELKKELAAKLSSMSEEEKRELKAQNEDLKAFQQAGETEEALRTIPRLALSDIDPACETYSYTVTKLSGNTLLRYIDKTNGIVYVTLLFPIDRVRQEDIPYVSMLCEILGSLDTGRHTREELGNAVNFHTGGIGMSIHVAQSVLPAYQPYFKVTGKCFSSELPAMLDLMGEQLTQTLFTDQKRLQDRISEIASHQAMRLPGMGHVIALNRALACVDPGSAFKDYTQGMEYYKALQELDTSFGGSAETVCRKMERLCRSIFTKDRLLLHITQEDSTVEEADRALSDWLRAFPSADGTDGEERKDEPQGEDDGPESEKDGPWSGNVGIRSGNVGYLSSAQVQYVGVAGAFSEPYSGSMLVLRSILSNDYLWNNVRVLGGAYGCMTGVSRLGTWYIVSYRDPGLTETLEVYRNLLDYVRNFDCTPEEMDSYIIGTISDISHPMTASMKDSMTLGMYLNHITNNMLQQLRDEVLATTVEDIRALAGTLEETASGKHLCVYGSETKLKDNRQLFDVLEKAI